MTHEDKIIEELGYSLFVEHIEDLMNEAEMAVRYDVKDKEAYYERLRTGSRALCDAIKQTLTTYRAQVLEGEKQRTLELIEGFKVDDGVSFEGALPPADMFAKMVDDTNMIREHVNGILDMLKEEITTPPTNTQTLWNMKT